MKNKRIIAAVTAVLMAGSAFSAQLTVGAEDNSVSNITVNNINNKEAVTKDGVIYHLFYDYAAAYRLTDEYGSAEEPFDIVIPDEINGLPVTEISPEAFSSTELQSVKFGKNIRTIGDYAFYNCKALIETEFPDTLENIGNCAFKSCRGLKKISFENKLVSIGRKAFQECKVLEALEFPDSLKKISDNAFEGCMELKEVKFGKSLEYIGDYAFNSCGGIKEVSLGDKVSFVGKKAFYEDGLRYFEIPAGVKELEGCPVRAYAEARSTFPAIRIINPECVLKGSRGEWYDFVIVCDEGSEAEKFAKENDLRYGTPEQYEKGEYKNDIAELPHGNTSWFSSDTMKWRYVDDGFEVFDICMGDGEELIIPDEIDGVPVVSVSNSAEYRTCNARLKKIVFGKNVRRINNMAFMDYEVLEEVEFGESLEDIGNSAFMDCRSLKKVTFNADCPLKCLKFGTFSLTGIDTIILPRHLEYVEQFAMNIVHFLDYSNYTLIAVLNPDCEFEPYSVRSSFPFIIGFGGSTAEKYARENGMKYQEFGSEDEIIKAASERPENPKDLDPMYVNRLAGDANCDGTVDLSDAVTIMQALANPNKYGLNGTHEKHITAQGVINGDVHGCTDGITSIDALWIQDYLLGDFDSFDD